MFTNKNSKEIISTLSLKEKRKLLKHHQTLSALADKNPTDSAKLQIQKLRSLRKDKSRKISPALLKEIQKDRKEMVRQQSQTKLHKLSRSEKANRLFNERQQYKQSRYSVNTQITSLSRQYKPREIHAPFSSMPRNELPFLRPSPSYKFHSGLQMNAAVQFGPGR